MIVLLDIVRRHTGWHIACRLIQAANYVVRRGNDERGIYDRGCQKAVVSDTQVGGEDGGEEGTDAGMADRQRQSPKEAKL